MKIQIKKEGSFGVVAINGVPVVGSRNLAETFGKRHDNVIQSIENSHCSEGFRNLNFKVSYYRAGKGKYKEYLLTRDGFTFIVMGFTGKKADLFKEAYIQRFNEMEQYIKSRTMARLESRDLTDAVALLHDPPKRYHYSNEFDMINKIVLGVRAREFRLKHGIQKDESIRDHLTSQEISAIEKLQAFDAHLAKVIPDYSQRQGLLKEYFKKISIQKHLELTGS